MTKVVNINTDVYDVRIDRTTIWGNPFIIGVHGTRKEVIQLYKQMLLNNQELLSQILKLDGKILGCHCKPKACHGDIIIEVIEMIKRERYYHDSEIRNS
jgi:hypothetical protein